VRILIDPELAQALAGQHLPGVVLGEVLPTGSQWLEVDLREGDSGMLNVLVEAAYSHGLGKGFSRALEGQPLP
jgi:hypothetical protein